MTSEAIWRLAEACSLCEIVDQVDIDYGVFPACGPLLKLPSAYAGWWNIPNLVQRNTILADWPLHLHVLLVETPTGNEGISL